MFWVNSDLDFMHFFSLNNQMMRNHLQELKELEVVWTNNDFAFDKYLNHIF